VAEPLECYTYDEGGFTLIGKGACRTAEITVDGPQNGTRYGNMAVVWVNTRQECETACANSSTTCVGVEYHPTASTTGLYKCETHFEELSAEEMSIFECWAVRYDFALMGDGQCNGGVGGTGEHYCLVGGTCNEGGEPISSTTEAGTGCPGEQEYLLCDEHSSIDYTMCLDACLVDVQCYGFMLSSHAAAGTARCELHTKEIEFVAEPLECYTYDEGGFTLIGKGACRTAEITVNGPQNGTRYGNMAVQWVNTLQECETACTQSSTTCVGIEYHPTASTTGLFKCETHFEELSAEEMSLFECWMELNSTLAVSSDVSLRGTWFVLAVVKTLMLF